MKTLSLVLSFLAAAAVARAQDEQLPTAPPADAAAVQKINALGGGAMPLAANTNLLSVNFSLAGAKIDDAALESLKGVSEQLVWLNLANTSVTDAGLKSLAGLKNLRRLHLEKTAVGDEGLAAVKSLGELSYLNLYATKVTDKGLANLAGLKKLKTVYLWQTAVTDAGAAELAKAVAGIYINRGIDPPAKVVEIAAPAPEKKDDKKDEKKAAGKPINAKCPLAGKDVDAAQTVTYKGQLIGFCCGNCKAKFEKEPEKYIEKVKEFKKEEKKSDAGNVFNVSFADPINKVCPVSGKDVNKEKTSDYEGQTIGFCCDNCKGKFDKEPAKYIGKVKEFKKKKAEVEEIAFAGDPINKVCPLTGKDINSTKTVDYEGQTIGFCCDDCKGKFESDPKKYIGKVKEFKKKKKAAAEEISFEDPINKKCPLTGKDIVAGRTVEYKKQTIGFCCADCVAKFEGDPEKFIKKVKEFKKTSAEEISFADPINKVCPVSGKDVNKEKTSDYEGQTIGFCCDNCKGKFDKEPAKYIGKVKEFKKKKAEVEEIAFAGDPINKVCPLTGKDINSTKTVDYEGQTIGFCCDDCKGKFESDPKKYIGKVKEFKKKKKAAAEEIAFAGDPINKVCPLTGKDINSTKTVDYEGQTIGFCCDDCKGKFESDPKKYIGKVKEFKKKKASIQEICACQLAADPINKVCPVSGKDVNKEKTSDYEGQTIGFCCDNCKGKFDKEPAKYIGKVKEFKKKKAEVEEIAFAGDPINKVCPLTGKDINSTKTVDYEGQTIGFCCDDCKGKFESDPKKYIGKVKEFKKKKKAAAEEISFEDPINKKCPLTGKDIVAGRTVEYKKQTIGFCCADCVAKFEGDPEKFIKKVKEFKKTSAEEISFADPINKVCPVSGKDVNKEKTSDYEGQTIGFCCDNCKGKFDKEPAKYIGKVKEFKKKKAEVEEIAFAGDPINKVCPLTGKDINSTKTVDYEGQTIGFCCDDCKGKFESDPKKYIGKVKEFKKKKAS